MSITQVVLVLVYAGILYTMVRPGSGGIDLVKATSGGLSDLLGASMGGGQTPGNTW